MRAGELYEVPIVDTLVLCIALPAAFPNVAPRLSVRPVVLHPFVDASGIVISGAHAKLMSWSPRESLGKLVYEVIANHFANAGTLERRPSAVAQPLPQSSQSPPVYTPAAAAGYPSYPGGSGVGGPGAGGGGGGGGHRSPPRSHTSPQSSHAGSGVGVGGAASGGGVLGDLPTSFPELHSLSMEQLQSLLTDATALDQFVDSLAYVQGSKELRDQVRDSNEEIARRNLEREAEVTALKAQVDKQREQLRQLRGRYDEVERKRQQLQQRQSRPTLLALLQQAAREAEAESDALAEDFVQGRMPLKDFLHAYQRSRSLFHLREAKAKAILKADPQLRDHST